jgi:hypothetical protein
MLIRICDHFKDNPKRIDKLIAIKGLPEEWIFRETPEGKELKKPWEPDVDKNIPGDIRNLCEPQYVILRYQAINNQAKQIIEKRQILGIRLDYNTEPGRQLWDDIERYIEESMPRNERIPVPVLCAKDERSAFETYRAVRNSRGSLELHSSPVPLVDLSKYEEVKMETKPVEEILKEVMPPEPIQSDNLKCPECDYTHKKAQGMRMHIRRLHPKKEKVGVS